MIISRTPFRISFLEGVQIFLIGLIKIQEKSYQPQLINIAILI